MTTIESTVAWAMLAASVAGAFVSLATLAVVAWSDRKEAGREP